MPLNRDAVLALTASSTIRWTARDAALYALGVGLGRNPLDIEALRYVALEPLRTLPSMMASLIVGHGVSAKQMGVLFRGVVHAAQRIVVPRPLPANAVARTASSILGVYDQGAEKGAAIVTCTRLIDDETASNSAAPKANCSPGRMAASADRRLRASNGHVQRDLPTPPSSSTCGPSRRSCSACRATPIRCTSTPASPERQVLRSQFFRACAPTAWPAAPLRR